jgi:uncharacterized membrane protein
MPLAPAQADALAARIAAVEARTGCEIVVALVDRADRYPEIRWKAFALGVAATALAVVAHDLWHSGWPGGLLTSIVVILAAGVANALAAQYVPAYGRVYVRHNRAEAEVRGHAESMFLARELFATPHRRALLLLVARFERVVALHADTGFAPRIGAADWASLIPPIAARLRSGSEVQAIEAGLDAIEALCLGKGFSGDGSRGNRLPDRPIEERGS